jgi:hypothetical protein
MSRTSIVRFAIGTAFGALALFWSGALPLNPQYSLMSTAHAVIGRPLTPMSYAGVARRTTRRAVGAGAVYGRPVVVAPAPVVVVPAPVVRAPRCVQAVDAYGRIYRRCY